LSAHRDLSPKLRYGTPQTVLTDQYSTKRLGNLLIFFLKGDGRPDPHTGVEFEEGSERIEIRIARAGRHGNAGLLSPTGTDTRCVRPGAHFKIGDADAFVDAKDPSQGLPFSGNIVKDPKLATGTFAQVRRWHCGWSRCGSRGERPQFWSSRSHDRFVSKFDYSASPAMDCHSSGWWPFRQCSHATRENRGYWFVLAFAASALGSTYGFLQARGRSVWCKRSGLLSPCADGLTSESLILHSQC
jgi:hypothetical protein